MPSARALFLDRDGTIIPDRGYLSDPAGVELYPGVAEGLQAAIRAGWLLFLHTNQSGIGRGFYTLADAEACNQRLFDLLALPHPGFSGVCIAPETSEQPIVYRKPSPRFAREMAVRFDLDLAASWMIGDRLTDLTTAEEAGLRGALLLTNPELPPETIAHARLHGHAIQPDLTSFLSTFHF